MRYTEDKPYTIQQMSRLTRVKEVTLRAWERRYGLLNPDRSEGRYRMYGQSDVDTIMRVSALLTQGIAIKQAAEQVQQEPAAEGVTVDSRWAEYINSMSTAVSRLDELALEDAWHGALAEHPLRTILREVIAPLMQELGRRWASGEGTVAEEHFFSLYLRNQLGAQFHHLHPRQGATRLLAAGLPGELHEIGLLMFALAAQSHGYRLTMLGSNMPLSELSRSAEQAGAKGIVLSGMLSDTFTACEAELKTLVEQSKVPVFIGGRVSTCEMKKITALNAVSLGMDIDHALKTMDKMLAE